MRPATDLRGHATLFVLAAIALGTALVLAGAAMDEPLSPQSELVLAAAAALGLLAFGIELRHDDHDAAMFGAVAALFGLLVFGAGALLGRHHHPVAAAGAVLCAAAFAGAFVHLFRLQRACELVPDVLGEAFEGVVVETDGVQWAVVEPDTFATAAYPAPLEVHLQNAHDGAREVVVHAEPARGLVAPARAPVRLAPLEVGVLRCRSPPCPTRRATTPCASGSRRAAAGAASAGSGAATRPGGSRSPSASWASWPRSRTPSSSRGSSAPSTA